MEQSEILDRLKDIQSDMSWAGSCDTNSQLCYDSAKEKLIELMFDLGFEGWGPCGYVPKKYRNKTY